MYNANTLVTFFRCDGRDGLDILIDPVTDESFCSISTYARMARKSTRTIYNRLRAVPPEGQITAVLPTAKRLRLISEDQIAEWLPKDNPEACRPFGLLGVRKALHAMAEYQIDAVMAAAPMNAAKSGLMPHEIALQVSETIQKVRATLGETHPVECQKLITYAAASLRR
jgi:hypothetical protein